MAEYMALDRSSMREVYALAHGEMIQNNLPIVLLTADFTYGMGLLDFQKKYPRNFLNVGIAEQNMVGIAAGLAEEGFLPFAHTFGVFAARRALDQIYISCAYAALPVKVVGADPGYTSGHNGGTHMAMEDTAVFRAVPRALVVEPTDACMLRAILPQIAAFPGFGYMRLARGKAVKVYGENSTFTLGKAVKLRHGTDATIIASGRCVADALMAADALARSGIGARVLDMFTIKPLDEEAVRAAARETGAIVTVENASKAGGLGGAVCECLGQEGSGCVWRMGRGDVFGEVAQESELKALYHLTARDIEDTVIKALERKKTVEHV